MDCLLLVVQLLGVLLILIKTYVVSSFFQNAKVQTFYKISIFFRAYFEK